MYWRECKPRVRARSTKYVRGDVGVRTGPEEVVEVVGQANTDTFRSSVKDPWKGIVSRPCLLVARFQDSPAIKGRTVTAAVVAHRMVASYIGFARMGALGIKVAGGL
jgi:hypothetical protein